MEETSQDVLANGVASLSVSLGLVRCGKAESLDAGAGNFPFTGIVVVSRSSDGASQAPT